MKGTDLARHAAGGHSAHADVLDAFKEQLLLVVIERLIKTSKSTKLVIPVSEVDATGGKLLSMAVVDNNFIFEVQVKQ